MDLNSLLASLPSQNSGQQQQQAQQQPQQAQNTSQNSLNDLLNSLQGVSSETNTSSSNNQSLEQALAALAALSSQGSSTPNPPASSTPSSRHVEQSSDNNSPSLDNVLDSIKEFTDGSPENYASPEPQTSQSSSPQDILSQLALLQTNSSTTPQSSAPPILTSTQPQSAAPPMLSSNPPQLSPVSLQLSATSTQPASGQNLNLVPPPNSLVPPPLSSSQHQSVIPPPSTLIPPPLSAQSQIPPPLSSKPPQLTPNPPTLSSNPPQLQSMPPPLTPNPPPLTPNPPPLTPNPPPLTPNPPPLTPNPPPLSSTPPKLSTMPPSLSSQAPPPSLGAQQPPQLSQIAGLFKLNLSSPQQQQQQQPVTKQDIQNKAAAASDAIQSLLNTLQNPNKNSPSVPQQQDTQTIQEKKSPAAAAIYVRPKTNYVHLDEFKIDFPTFDLISSNMNSTVRLTPGQTIQSVLDKVPADSTVEIPSGTYTEEIEINKPVTLVAVGGAVELKGKGETDVILSRAEYFEIQNFNISQISSKSGGALNISNGFCKIINCTIKCPLLSPVNISSNSKVYIESCNISDGHNPNVNCEDTSFVFINKSKISKTQTFGVLAKGNSKVIVSNCEIFDIESNAVSSAESGTVYLKNSNIHNIKNSGFETASTSKCYVENCTFNTIDACGVCANAAGQEVIVHHCTFTKCDMAAIKSSSHSKIRTLGNVYKDIGSNVMVIANDEGVIQCEKDEFEGTCLSAITAFSNGLVIGQDLHFENISGSAVLSYEKGHVQIDIANIKNCKGPSIHLRDHSVCKMRNIIVKNGQCAEIVINDGSTGEIIDSNFNSSITIGAEIANTSNFTFVNCDFSDNKACGISFHDQVKAIFENCKFNRNQFGVDISGNGCSPTFNNCEFSNNQEVGSNCLSSSPTFNKCTFNFNGKMGLGCKSANLTINDSLITKNGQVGATIYGGSTLILNRTTFDTNDNSACQISQKGSVMKLFDCKVINHLVSCVVLDEAKIRCRNTIFDKSRNPHFDVARGGFASLNSCDIGPSFSGNGIQVHDNGRIKMRKTKVHHQAKLGILVGNQGICQILDHSIFENNGQIAVVCLENSKTEILNSTLNSNGLFAVQAQGGELTVQNCTISNHTQCAVFASKNVKLSYSGNNFTNNGAKDIVIQ